MPEEWLIDGYNLLYDLKTTKDILLSRLAALAASRAHPIFVVFDGVGSDAEFESYKTPYLRAVYSQSASADTVIERYIYENKAKTRLVVFTNDRAVCDIARGSGALVRNTQDFLKEIELCFRENSDILFHEKVKSRGFHRPFEDKL